MTYDWRPRIVEMVYIKQAVADADKAGLWEHRLPGVAASEEEVQDAERALGFTLDARYRDFLRFANGWPAFYHDVNLFGTRELVSGMGRQELSYIEAEALAQAGVDAAGLLPIAVSQNDLDLFVLGMPSAPNAGEVLWFAGGLIDRFPDFEEYFLAMADYNRLQVDRLKASDA